MCCRCQKCGHVAFPPDPDDFAGLCVGYVASGHGIRTGSASRHSIGTGVFFGMIAAITIGIVLVPFFFVMVYKFKEKIRVKTKSVK